MGLIGHSSTLAVPYLPGVITPSEVGAARNAGFVEMKLYPVEQYGGLGLVGSLAAIYPDISFVPTGGIDADTAPAYMAHPNVAAVGGSWIAPRSLIAAGDWDEISRRAVAATTQPA